jgi:ribosomal protein S18 acetylase RimI-like enzyme
MLKEKTNYKLDEEYNLISANPREFAIHYTTYRENIFFRQSWERRVEIITDDVPCYWITFHNQRIGGVCLKPNMLWSFFIEPPFSDIYRVLSSLKKYLIEISDKTKSIEIYGILPYQAEHFLRLGFLPSETRRMMIRPTEKFNLINWDSDLIVINPTPQYTKEIAQLSYESYSGPDRIGYPNNNTIDHQRLDVEYYFKHNNKDFLKHASRLVFDKTNNKLVGLCLISLWEDLPLVSNIVVDPKYRGRSIATNLLKESLTVLNKQFEIIRLFVTVGNAAESVYYNLGFLPGIEQITFTLPCKANNDS